MGSYFLHYLYMTLSVDRWQNCLIKVLLSMAASQGKSMNKFTLSTCMLIKILFSFYCVLTLQPSLLKIREWFLVIFINEAIHRENTYSVTTAWRWTSIDTSEKCSHQKKNKLLGMFLNLFKEVLRNHIFNGSGTFSYSEISSVIFIDEKEKFKT